MFRDKLPNIRLDPVIKHNAKKGCSISAPYHISSQSFLPLRIVSGSERRKETVQAAGHQSSHITHTHISKQDTTPHISHTHTHTYQSRTPLLTYHTLTHISRKLSGP